MLIDKRDTKGVLSSYKLVGRNGEIESTTHLLFANDTLVFYNDSEEQKVSLCWILFWFEALLGLKINLEKSYTIPVGEMENVQ